MTSFSRRAVLAELLTLALVAAPLVAHGQTASKLYRIGVLDTASRARLRRRPALRDRVPLAPQRGERIPRPRPRPRPLEGGRDPDPRHRCPRRWCLLARVRAAT